MQDINFIANYYLGTKAYTIFMLKTLFKTEETDYIKNKNYKWYLFCNNSIIRKT